MKRHVGIKTDLQYGIRWVRDHRVRFTPYASREQACTYLDRHPASSLVVRYVDGRYHLPVSDWHPEPPTNVRLDYGDGTERPVDCSFGGWDCDGYAVWHVINGLSAPPLRILIGKLPPKTSVRA